MSKLNAAIARLSLLAPVILRIAVGGVMTFHGIQKFRAPEGAVEGMFEMMQVPAAGLSAMVVTYVEIIAGIALIIGIATRVAAALLSAVLIGAIFLVKADLGIIASGPMPGAELDIALLGGLLALVLLGPGPLSVDEALHLEPAGEPAPAAPRPAQTA